MDIFKRLPVIHLNPDNNPFIPYSEQKSHPAFATDFTILNDDLMPLFHELDKEALKQQNRYRWMYIILIFGNSLVTILGTTQLALPTTNWLAIGTAIVAAGLATATTIARAFHFHTRYLTTRLASEQLRSHYFLFLSRQAPYNDEQDRIIRLRQRVATIRRRAYDESESE